MCVYTKVQSLLVIYRGMFSLLLALVVIQLFFFFIIIICKLYPTHMENSHISQTPSYSPRLDSSQQLGNDRSIPLRAVSTRLKTGPI